jgi:hypothetical protein
VSNFAQITPTTTKIGPGPKGNTLEYQPQVPSAKVIEIQELLATVGIKIKNRVRLEAGSVSDDWWRKLAADRYIGTMVGAGRITIFLVDK